MLLHNKFVVLASAAALMGCANFGYQPSDDYPSTRAAAFIGNPGARLNLARMYANPAAWPQMHGREPDPVRAAKWCYIFQSQGAPADPAVAAMGPSCQQIMASLPPDAVNSGVALGFDSLTQVRNRGGGG